MTTTVIVNAHLSTDKEVKVAIIDSNENEETFTLQDGESGEYTVYDDRTLTIKEVEK